VICYRHAATNRPFLWEIDAQPAARWNRDGQGPVQYLADTPGGAWAEFLRHEGITELDDLAGIRRALWAIEVPDDLDLADPALPLATLTGGLDTYFDCRDEADRIRAAGHEGVNTVSAALRAGAASGWTVDSGVHRKPPIEGRVIALFGRRPDLTGWPVVRAGAPPVEILEDTEPL
jgi:hypothetical protein